MLIDLLGPYPKAYAQLAPNLLLVKTLAESMRGPKKGSLHMAVTRPVQSLSDLIHVFSVKPMLEPSWTDAAETGWEYVLRWTTEDHFGAQSQHHYLVTLIQRDSTWSCWCTKNGPTELELDLPDFDPEAGTLDDTKVQAQVNPSIWTRLNADDL